jgi:hypothetical protein
MDRFTGNSSSGEEAVMTERMFMSVTAEDGDLWVRLRTLQQAGRSAVNLEGPVQCELRLADGDWWVKLEVVEAVVRQKAKAEGPQGREGTDLAFDDIVVHLRDDGFVTVPVGPSDDSWPEKEINAARKLIRRAAEHAGLHVTTSACWIGWDKLAVTGRAW